MNLREVLTALRAHWWLSFLGLIVGGGAALGISVLQLPMYTSATQLFVSTIDNTSTSAALSGSQFSQQRVTSYAKLITGDELAGRVIKRLSLRMSTTQLSQEITATAVVDTVLLNVTVTDPSPHQAQRIAYAVGSEFSAFATELEKADVSGASPVKVTVTDRPGLPTAPSSPKTLRNVASGLLVGLLLGAGVAIARVRLDRTVKNADELMDLVGVPVIGTVLRDAALEKQHLIVRSGTNRTAEDYRQLRTNLQFLNVDEPPRVIMISSAVPSEGKTTVVVNLALALADAGRTVTVLEADLRRPKVTRYLGIVSGVGLTNILAGSAELDDVTQTYGTTAFKVIAAGPTPPNPGELLSSSHMKTLIDKLRTENDFVLVDAPPVLPVADASGLAVAMDGVLLSVRYGSTTKEQLRQAAATLDRVGAKTLGIILNIVPPKAQVASSYRYGYSYASEGGDHRK